jgi:exodeoxyribonuclease V alpha subunit
MTRLEGTVERIVFRAPDGAFAVVRIKVSTRDQPATAIGPLADAIEGESVALDGEWERHPTHGEQFRASRAVVQVPRTAEGVQRYLEGLDGIGPALADRLVRSFGVDAIDVLEKEPWRAAQVKGVGKRRAERAAAHAAGRRQEREVMIFLQGLGVSLAWANRIHKRYGADAVRMVQDNPYRLAREVPGIGFQTADRIARAAGIGPGDSRRIEGGVVHVLSTLVDEGNVYAPPQELEARACAMLEVEAAAVREAALALAREGALVVEEGALYLPRLHRAEVELGERIHELLGAVSPAPALRAPELARLSDGQRRALEDTREAAIAVITGGPGTGKTTVTRALVASWEAARRRVLLAAPTGRAAKRLAEATGRPAQTVHRLLEWGRPALTGPSAPPSFGGGPAGTRGGLRGPFARDRSNPLVVDLLVVDEASMLDLPLARALFDAVPPGAHVVLVGDVDQLPPVGAGQVLADVIASGVVPVARLREVFRQAEGSGIVDNAYRILSGELPVGAGRGDKGDFYVVSVDDPEQARERVVRLCRERIPEAFGLDPVRDVQVLTPMHRGIAGTDELNRALQAALNPGTGGAEQGGRTFRAGDKVMQVKNDYDRDVFNGDLGRVLSAGVVDGEAHVEVDFDGKRARYVDDELDQLELAYAVSVHKSQGSEYPAVVLTMLPQHFVLLRRNLFYTAVTRGRKLVVVVAAPRALKRAVEDAHVEPRHTRLAARLRDKLRGQ